MSRRSFIFAVGVIAASCVGFVAGRSSVIEAPWQAELEAGTTRTSPVVSADRLSGPVFSGSDSSGPVSFGPTVSGPVIGIASLTSDTYVRAIRDSGGIPVVLPNADGSVAKIDEYLKLLDGLLMPGGADIPPSEWGEEQHPTTKLLDDDRYQFEKAMITAWIEKTDKPLLGICLGSQWINVAHGGSLIQDIPSEFGVNHRGVSHMVTLESDSRLSRMLGQTEFEVNSLHHQAVRHVGKGLRVVGRSPDGIIEATETTDPDRFLFGVQWHPEKLVAENKVQQKLMQAFIDAALKGKK